MRSLLACLVLIWLVLLRLPNQDPFSPEPDSPIEALCKELTGKEPKARAKAATRLGEMGTEAERALPLLYQIVLSDNDPETRWAAILAMGKISTGSGRALSTLTKCLSDSYPYNRLAAAKVVLSWDNRNKEAISELTLLLSHKNSALRGSAALTLGGIKANAEPVLPKLLPLLKDSDVNVRQAAAQALGEIGLKPRLVVPALVEATTDKSSIVRLYAIQSLGCFSKDARTAVPVITRALNAEKDIRLAAVQSLGLIGGEASVSVPSLALLLRESDPEVQIIVISSLQHIHTSNCIIPLTQLLTDPSEDVRVAARNALMTFGRKAVAPIADLARDGKSVHVKLAAISLLGQIGLRTPKCVAALKMCQQDDDPNVRKIATEVLTTLAK